MNDPAGQCAKAQTTQGVSRIKRSRSVAHQAALDTKLTVGIKLKGRLAPVATSVIVVYQLKRLRVRAG